MKKNILNNTHAVIFLLCSFFILFMSQCGSAASEINSQIHFDSNASIDTYFAGLSAHEGQDGLNSTKAYILDGVRFAAMFDYKSSAKWMLKFTDTTRYVIIQNCVFENTYEDTIHVAVFSDFVVLDNCANIIIRNCTFINRAGIDSVDCTNIVIENNQIDRAFVNVMRGLDINILSNRLGIFNTEIRSMKDYFYSRTGSINLSALTNSTIVNNTVSDTSTGLSISSMDNCTIEHNTLLKCKFGTTMQISHTNTVNGGKYYYYRNEEGLTAANFTDAAQISIYECSNSVVSGVYSKYIEDGINIGVSNNITIANCTSVSPFNSGIIVSSCKNINIVDNCVFGWVINPNIWSKATKEYAVLRSPTGISISTSFFEDQTENVTVTRNVMIGCMVGIHINELYDLDVAIYNITVYDNLYANNSINGQMVTQDEQIMNDALIRFDNTSIGNYWDDYEEPRTTLGISSPSSSSITESITFLPISSDTYLTWDSPYEANGIIDNKPLKAYLHPFDYPDFTPLYPWEIESITVWIITGAIVGSLVLVAIAVIVIKRKNRIIEE